VYIVRQQYQLVTLESVLVFELVFKEISLNCEGLMLTHLFECKIVRAGIENDCSFKRPKTAKNSSLCNELNYKKSQKTAESCIDWCHPGQFDE